MGREKTEAAVVGGGIMSIAVAFRVSKLESETGDRGKGQRSSDECSTEKEIEAIGAVVGGPASVLEIERSKGTTLAVEMTLSWRILCWVKSLLGLLVLDLPAASWSCRSKLEATVVD
ncbi:hypothetical protein F0562_012288 [Nyssa sinensis]|uniref:Uncharacterized protein n=1 Tax=Nyssa sinensis TaxID=561372 RepID=A0A5J4ZSB4_9ASTE|nr:hypothetical protein F0562_012288 [Nyssa sinensis]